jgi:hypothetical protein
MMSVEAENPSRAGLDMLIAEADVVFYAKGWAQVDQAFLPPITECSADLSSNSELG